VSEFKARLGLKELPDEDRGIYNTVAGLVMAISGELPAEGDVVEFDDWRFEVMDLDGRRIDKLLVSQVLNNEGAALA
jgi:putative hemolysin